jgi:hypothetical protein
MRRFISYRVRMRGRRSKCISAQGISRARTSGRDDRAARWLTEMALHHPGNSEKGWEPADASPRHIRQLRSVVCDEPCPSQKSGGMLLQFGPFPRHQLLIMCWHFHEPQVRDRTGKDAPYPGLPSWLHRTLPRRSLHFPTRKVARPPRFHSAYFSSILMHRFWSLSRTSDLRRPQNVEAR